MAQSITHVNATLTYRYDATGESGREWVKLTSDRNSNRTVRALSELDDIGLKRDATITYGPDLRAQDAYIRIARDGICMGSGWYRFGADFVSLEAHTALEGRVSQYQAFEEPIGVFAPHPVFLDGWHSWFHNPNGPPVQELRNCITSSPLWDGSSGPMICIQHRKIERLADAKVKVPAGTFVCESYRLIPHAPGRPPIAFWVHGPHKIFVKLRWDYLKATYELASLEQVMVPTSS